MSQLSKFEGAIPGILCMDVLRGFHKNARKAFFSEDLDEKLVEEFRLQLCNESFLAYLRMVFPRMKKRRTKIPMLVLGAANDAILPPSEMEEAAQFYGAECQIIPDVAHNMMLDTRQDTVSAAFLLQWMEGKL